MTLPAIFTMSRWEQRRRDVDNGLTIHDKAWRLYDAIGAAAYSGRSGASRVIANNTRATTLAGGAIRSIRLHNTDIITMGPDPDNPGGLALEFNSGGYRTVTTAERLNRYLQPLGLMFSRIGGQWTIIAQQEAIPHVGSGIVWDGRNTITARFLPRANTPDACPTPDPELERLLAEEERINMQLREPTREDWPAVRDVRPGDEIRCCDTWHPVSEVITSGVAATIRFADGHQHISAQPSDRAWTRRRSLTNA